MIIRKIPVALFIAAALIVGFAVVNGNVGGDSASAGLPDPADVRAASTGRIHPAGAVTFWSQRVEADPTDHLSRAALGDARMALAAVTGDPELFELAEADYRAVLAVLPDDPTGILGLIGALSAQHRFAEASSLAQSLLAEDSDDPAALVAVGDTSLELGNEEAAFETYRRLGALEPADPATLSRRARTAWLTGHGGQAVDLATAALRTVGELDLAPADATFYWFQLATYRYETGDIAGAEDVLRAGLEILPSHGASLELLATVLIADARLDEAATVLEGLTIGGGPADLHGLLADVYRALGRESDADEQLRIGLGVAARDIERFPAERRHLAGFLVGEDPGLALELMELDATERSDVAGLDLLAWSLHENGLHEQAAAVSERAMRLGTRDVEMLFHAGMIAAANGETDDARRLLSEALDINPRFDLVEATRAAETLSSLGTTG